ncbi:MAG TPA: hypothetical protein VHW47_08425 [Acidimicrobiales bacterium]|jgi:hypothetical protein|nr:hypothetical protein [Acidimicrobiales bacterium]
MRRWPVLLYLLGWALCRVAVVLHRIDRERYARAGLVACWGALGGFTPRRRRPRSG